MAKDNDNDKNKKTEIKNPELLSSEKETVPEILDRGPKGVPKEGQTWADKTTNEKKSDIKKPDLYHDAMKTKEVDKEKEKPKQLDKDIDHDKD